MALLLRLGTPRATDKPMRTSAKIFITASASLGFAIMLFALRNWECKDPVHLIAYLAIALVASGLKVRLPDVNGTMSVNFLFILLGIMELSFPETMLIGCTATLVQCFLKMSRPTKFVRVVFNVFSMMPPAVAAAYYAFHGFARFFGHSQALMIMAAGSVYFFANTVSVAAIISLAENQPFRKTWRDCYFWSFPYYLAGAGLVALIHLVNSVAGWQTTLLVLPVVYWVYRSYRLYLSKLENEKRHVEDEKRHVQDMASLHLRTIEALALAIDAKDHITHDHLQRVRVYAIEIGKELGLSGSDLEALKAAAMLHDIGKLAVPEHIINKPGKLTPEEFDKMKIHPTVGAEILARVRFPYDVVPIVRSHHEKWDGTGYPDGLRGDAIPIAARILSAVDCLDALASDRPYRRALPLEEAMDEVAKQSGRDFDPQVVAILKRRYIELERLARSEPTELDLSLAIPEKVERGAAPAAGFEAESARSVTAQSSTSGSFLHSIAAAHQEAQMLLELTHDLGSSLSLDETLSLVSARLRKLIPYDAIAVWIRNDDALIPAYVNGDNFRMFASLRIPMGQGLSGWVAQNCKPIFNGNPSVEPEYLHDPTKISTLRSAISVPLGGLTELSGALTLYREGLEAFSKDHLRILLAISSKVALSIENAMKYQQAENSATTDYLTGLPNARALFLQLDREVARCERSKTPLAVLVCDLNGFKNVNDRYGHLEGNRVLRLFSNLVKDCCREYDCVARMGGDEFVIVAPGMDPEAAREKALRLHRCAIEAGAQVCRDQLLSASVGMAFFPQDGDDAEQLLAVADRQMYIAKRSHYREAEIPRLGSFPTCAVVN